MPNSHVNSVRYWESIKGIQRIRAGPFDSVEQDVTMAEDRVDDTAASPRSLQRYGKSEIIFEQGSTGDEMYLISKGKVMLSVQRDETQQIPLAVLNPGDFFGEMALVDDSPRSATASAVVDDTELIVMDRTRFLFMVRQQPEFALSLMHTLCRRLRDMDERLPSEGS